MSCFGVSTARVTHIPRKMCHFFGVSTGLVTHIPLKMCMFLWGREGAYGA